MGGSRAGQGRLKAATKGNDWEHKEISRINGPICNFPFIVNPLPFVTLVDLISTIGHSEMHPCFALSVDSGLFPVSPVVPFLGRGHFVIARITSARAGQRLSILRATRPGRSPSPASR
jgi:hypothetical protein